MAIMISESDFRDRIKAVLSVEIDEAHKSGRASFQFVTGPGRSGAVAAVYASHILGISFLPFKSPVEAEVGKDRMIMIDTAVWTGKTLKKGTSWYAARGFRVKHIYMYDSFAYEEPTRHIFWYERDYVDAKTMTALKEILGARENSLASIRHSG